MEAGAPDRLILDRVTFDVGEGLLRDRAGEIVPLRPQSAAVLARLAARPGRVVTKDELFDAVWPGVAVTENSLSQCVSEIRKAIGDERQVVLRTVSRRGYMLVPPPTDSQSSGPAPAAAEARPQARASPGARRYPAAIAAALVTLAIVIGAAFMLRQPATPKVPETLSAAVLPFANLSADADQAYLSTGITEDLTSALARVPGLFVVSRNAAKPYEASPLGPSEVAGRLGVRYLIEGSVRRQGDDVRINARLIDATDEGQLWGATFDGRFDYVFALQDRVVDDIVAALQIRLVAGKANLAVSGDTTDPAAYQAFRLGLEARRRDTVAGTVEALGHLRRALALDPRFGAAAAELAWLHWDLDDERRRAIGISWREVDDNVHASLEAAAANPSPTYFQLVADLLVRENRAVEAIAMLTEAIRLDPSDPWTYEGLSQALNFAGRPAEARGHLETALRVDPGWNDWRRYQAGLSAFGEGRYADAVEVLSSIDLDGPSPWSKFYGLHVKLAALGQLGRTDETTTAYRALEQVLAARGDGAPNLLVAQQFFVFARNADTLRFLQGLRRAGMPDLPQRFASSGRARQSGPQIARFFFGAELRGRQLLPETAPYRSTIGPDGAMEKTIGGVTLSGKAWVQEDFFCQSFPRALTNCAAVFAAPGGAPEGRDEYSLVFRFQRIAVSPER